MLLAIDTATRNASVALYNADGVQAEITWYSRENHTVELMPQIVHVMELANTERKDLQAIGIAQGPGSFTGLRVGMSIAKGFAYALEIPIFGISTIDAIASAHALQNLPIYAILAAGRGRYSVGHYGTENGAARLIGDYALVNADGMIEVVTRDNTSRALFCGDLDAAISKRIQECLGTRAVLAPPALNARRAGLVAELAWERFIRGKPDDTASLAPVYATDRTKR